LSAVLDEVLAALLEETPDVELRRNEYLRQGVVFAARPQPDAVELRLGAEIADAASQTPGTSASSRGADWVLLQPTDWKSARDRLEAWYRVAWRLAVKR
jgi:hypothetical protein